MDYSKMVKPNSNASKNINNDNSEKQENKVIEKVVKGNVVAKKRSLGKKFADVFISEDIANVKNYVITDVLIPTIRDTIFEIITNSLSMALGIDVKRRNGSYNNTSKVRYSDYYGKTSKEPTRRPTLSYEVMDIILDSRAEAEEVISVLIDLIDNYKVARVADFYDLVGLPTQWTDNNYGWTNLASARTEHVSGGYLIKLPRPVSID